jgi:surface carbohydrate biosynthesis protein
MPRVTPKYLYLPIEIWVREFHAKTLLGVQAAKSGWSVIIGPKTAMDRRLQTLPQGTVFQFGLHENFVPAMEKLHCAGHQVVAVDEEGLVTLNPEQYLRYRVSSKAIENSDACFCWGNTQLEMLKSIQADPACEFHITGNPRMDLLRPEFRDLIDKEAEQLKQKYGDFLLVNGNFGSYNHVMGLEYTWQALQSKGWMNTASDAEFHRRRVELQGRFFHAFQEAIPELSAAGYRVIIRPHPSESLKPWEKLAIDYPDQVLVIREGNVVPWLQAANVVIHNGCTTAVEAFVLGRPVIAYRPEIQYELESEFPNKISLQATTMEELMSFVENAEIQDQLTRKERESYASNFLVGMSGATSSERMVKSLPMISSDHQQRSMHSMTIAIGRWSSVLREGLSRVIKKQEKYVGLKCGKLDLKETITIVNEFSKRLKIEHPLKVNAIGNGLIKIVLDE